MRTRYGVPLAAKRRSPWIIPLLAIAFLSGCATTPYRAHPQFEERLRSGLRVAVMPPDVKVYQITAGEVQEQMDEWTETARKNVVAAISKRLTGGGGLTIRDFDPTQSEAAREEFEDARWLFQAVALSAALHAYPTPVQLETKKERFDYTLGPLPTLAQASEADALLFVQGLDHISTSGRVARDVILTILAVAATAAARSPIIFPGPSGGVTGMWAALVDAQTGDVLWFNKYSTAGAHDLRDPVSAEEFVSKTLEGLTTFVPTATPVKLKQQ